MSFCARFFVFHSDEDSSYGAMKMQVEVLWVVTLCSYVVRYWYFRTLCCLHRHNQIFLSFLEVCNSLWLIFYIQSLHLNLQLIV